MIRVAINGYGNLGRGVELALTQQTDMECVAVFTRRDPETVTTLGTPTYALSSIDQWQGKIDVLVNCGGSATDLAEQGPQMARMFHTVDSFDTHAKIPEHFAALDAASRNAGTLALISTGWDPGLFSLARVLSDAVLPNGQTTTFWGPGISQGHSDAIRRIPGVAQAKQYTVPVQETVDAVKAGRDVELTPRTMHRRECYVVAEPGADESAIRKAIVTMPNYFADYDTTVTFIDTDTFAREHSGMPHGGEVIRSGETREDTHHTVTFSLDLDMNPEFTGSVLVAYARGVARMAAAGRTGAITVFDVPLSAISAHDSAELRAQYL